MAEDRDELVARQFIVMEDVAVPDLWERVMTLTDTERVDAQRTRRRWPTLAAAAVLVAVVAAGFVVFLRDETQPVDGSITPADGADSTVHIVVRDGGVDLTPTVAAGWVSIRIDNRTDRQRSFTFAPLLPGKTYDDVEAAAAAFRDGDSNFLDGIVSDVVIGGLDAAHDTHTVGVSLPAGDYVAIFTELDGDREYVPGSGQWQRLRVVDGAPGQRPEPTATYRITGGGIAGPSTLPAGPVTIAFDASEPSNVILSDLRDGVSAAEWTAWANQLAVGETDFDEAPIDSVIVLIGTSTNRTITLDLDSGPIEIGSAPSGTATPFWDLMMVQVG